MVLALAGCGRSPTEACGVAPGLATFRVAQVGSDAVMSQDDFNAFYRSVRDLREWSKCIEGELGVGSVDR